MSKAVTSFSAFVNIIDNNGLTRTLRRKAQQKKIEEIKYKQKQKFCIKSTIQ